jgi:hypothetical protein
MADQGLWFKLWCSADDDPDLDNLDIADFGRWCKLGLQVKAHGTDGTLVLRAPARSLCAKFQVPDFDALVDAILRFPHVQVRRDAGPVSGETVATVTFRNWAKYQGDFSTGRVRRFRQMKRSRGEEKRGEETRTRREEKKAADDGAPLPPWVATLPFPPIPAAWWQRQLGLFPGLDHEAVLRDAAAYWVDHRRRYRNVQAFIRNQLVRAFRRETREAAKADPYAGWPVFSDEAEASRKEEG